MPGPMSTPNGRPRDHKATGVPRTGKTQAVRAGNRLPFRGHEVATPTEQPEG